MKKIGPQAKAAGTGGPGNKTGATGSRELLNPKPSPANRAKRRRDGRARIV